MKILKINRVPRWKFWKTDQWEVTVLLNDETIKKISIFGDTYEHLFLSYVRKKILYGDQWSNKDSMSESSLQKFVGREIKE